MSPLPVEWMDPMSWRLPSGKALAEFALQSGFLAPLIMGGPLGRAPAMGSRKRTEKAATGIPPSKDDEVNGGAATKSAEVPVSAGSFRGGSFREVANRFR